MKIIAIEANIAAGKSFLITPLIPALQSLATRQVDPGRQGQFQGVLASALSLASIAGPLVFTSVYYSVQSFWPGGIWLSVVVIYIIAIPLVNRGTRSPIVAEQS